MEGNKERIAIDDSRFLGLFSGMDYDPS